MMVEEHGIVVAVDGDSAWVETQPKSACGHCNVGSSCGTSLLAKWFARKRNRVQVKNQLGLQPGDGAVVGINEQVLTKAAFMAYMMPLLCMIVLAMAASGLGVKDASVALCSLLGLGLGLVLMKVLNGRVGSEGVNLIRRAPQEKLIELDNDFIERGYNHE
jgi:sigma-E factor negative regulatory protein RseC